MKDIRMLFEYQKIQPNCRLQSKIDSIAEKYLSDGVELADDDLNVAAAGDLHQSEPPLEDTDADKG